MARKKKFGLSSTLNQGFSDAVSVVENNDQGIRYTVVPLHRIERDPNNPRELHITEKDLPPHRLLKEEPQYTEKQSELQELTYLANTIKEKGVLQPILLYKHTDKYQIIAGECRFLASLLAGKTDIPARIFDKKPTLFDIRQLQWIENNSRQNLSLRDQLTNVRQLVKEYAVLNSNQPLSASKLGELLNVSKSHAHRYMGALSASKAVSEAITDGRVQNLKVIELLNAIDDREMQISLLKEHAQGVGLMQLKSIIKNRVLTTKSDKKPASRGRELTRINLGHTKNIKVVETIVRAVTKLPEINAEQAGFSHVDWSSLNEANQAFKKLIALLEKRA